MRALFVEKKECCGCSACLNICPKQAIQMKEDFKGYLYPQIDKSLCVGCNLCEKVCPLKHEVKKNNFTARAFGMKNKDANERRKSSSGSVFIEAAKYILDQGGIVYGVRMSSRFQVEFGRATSLKEAREFQGSKYVQSIKADNYKMVKKDLEKGKFVLFTGTPCEIGGLKKYLGKEYDKLYTLDIICHGVPSQKLLQKCIAEREEKNHAKIKEMTFRDKTYGWRHQEINMTFENNKNYHAPIWEDEFYRLFTSNYILRESCYSCCYANMERVGDMTIGDFWNIKNVYEAFEDNLGVSSLLINSEKGKDLFDRIRENFESFECSLDDIEQTNLKRPSLKPEDYESFQRDYQKKGMSYCLRRYGKMGKVEMIKRFLSPMKKKLMDIVKK